MRRVRLGLSGDGFLQRCRVGRFVRRKAGLQDAILRHQFLRMGIGFRSFKLRPGQPFHKLHGLGNLCAVVSQPFGFQPFKLRMVGNRADDIGS